MHVWLSDYIGNIPDNMCAYVDRVQQNNRGVYFGNEIATNRLLYQLKHAHINGTSSMEYNTYSI